MELRLSQFDFPLPPELIAQEPAPERDGSRLLVLHRRSGKREHLRFRQILEYLNPGDVLVVNDTRVVPARLLGRKRTGGQVECLILRYPSEPVSQEVTTSCLLRAAGKIKVGERIFFGEGLEGEIMPPSPNGTALVRFRFSGPFEKVLETYGRVPLPPYIRRNDQDETRVAKDRERYQTLYARHPGAVAAPTAGLHFSQDLIAAIQKKGVLWVSLTLHVGYGTFAPIKTDRIEELRMHAESFNLSEDAARTLLEQKERGHKVIAVGTTVTRVLEHVAHKYGTLRGDAGECDLFIKPGFTFKVIDGLVTNFHLPRTTLLLLVSAFAGREQVLEAYNEAVEHRYRFFSYGDAMFIL